MDTGLKQIGNYRIIEPIDIGSSASVFRAHHTILEDVVALKILRTPPLSDKECERFLEEAKLLKRLRHRHILPVHDAGIYDGLPYLATEYASGGSLRHRLKQTAPSLLGRESVLTILTQVGSALQYIHQNNVVHCDLKPENILFNAQGDVLLADFGISTVLATASVKFVATTNNVEAYMAPEQFQSEMVSKEGDQYSLGCIAYELFTGRCVFSAPGLALIGAKHINEQPKPLRTFGAIPTHIEQAVLKALVKERKERHPDVMAFINALNNAPQSTPEVPQAVSEIREILLLAQQKQFISQQDKDHIDSSVQYFEQEKYGDALRVIYPTIENIITDLLREVGERGYFKGLGPKIDKLVQKGIIPSEDAHAIEMIAPVRNKIVHGDYSPATKALGSAHCLTAFRYLRMLLTEYSPNGRAKKRK